MPTENYNFKCKKCGNTLSKDGKSYGTNWVFFMCLGEKGCANGFWIDIITKKDHQGHYYGQGN